MFKNKFKALGLAALLFTSFGCSEWLDVKPGSETILDDFWKTESQAQSVLMACYRSLTEPGNISRMIVWGETRSDNLVAGPGVGGDLYRILEVDLTPSNSYCDWGSMYTTINYCNTFLHFAPDVLEYDENFTQGELLTMSAEVLTIRALAYFYLVRAYRDVPLILEASVDDTQDYLVAKSTESEILNQIIGDLTYAENFLRENYETEALSKVRITKTAARALLADVYLWDQQYELAVQKCNEVIQNPSLELVEGEDLLYEVFYNGYSTESIFELDIDDDEISNSTVSNFYGSASSRTGVLTFALFLTDPDGDKTIFERKISSSLYESEEDLRYKDFINQSLNQTGYNVAFKYAGLQRTENANGNSQYFYPSSTPNWIIYRLPDVLLMKAEALVQLNRSEADLQEAMDMVNTTYLRSNPELSGDSLTLDDYTTTTDLEELILRERQRELMFEGKRWFDLMRLAKRDNNPDRLLNYVVLKFTGDQTLQYSKMSVMDALYFPIPQREINANPLLEQNPFYEVTSGVERTE